MPFSASSFRFLRSLARHNKRPWFEAHREDYEAFLRAPMRDLVEEMDVRFARFAPEILGDPKRSMFRIHRDIRFSRDKSPYKTNAGCWFFHRDGRHNVGQESEGGGAGFYFHFQPGQCFTGGGLWMPPRPSLNKLRDAIVEDRRTFERVALSPGIKKLGGLDEENSLKRVPRGYAPDHPAGKWLRLQSYIAGGMVKDRDVLSGRLADLLEKQFKTMLPLVRWINGVLGLRPAIRR